MNPALDVFLTFLRLGCTSFGGPVAHLGYFREEFVNRRKWLSDADYADLVALCTFLPGPSSSQVGMSIGKLRAGTPGAVLAWIGFTTPSALIMLALALGANQLLGGGLVRGLSLLTLSVILSAVLGMARTLAPDWSRRLMALISGLIMLSLPGAWTSVLVIALGGIYGVQFFRQAGTIQKQQLNLKKTGIYLGVATVLLLVSPLLLGFSPYFRVFGEMYRTGSLVFGGGHVVLPLLQPVATWLTPEQFLGAYGAAQAIPGPVFAISTFLGATFPGVLPAWGGLIATVGIFLPALLLVLAIMPVWDSIKTHPTLQSALKGVNAAVVGLLFAALLDAGWTIRPSSWIEWVWVVASFVLLHVMKVPAHVVVFAGGLLGYFLLG
ncbi:chromate efflux transporter [Deinococcus cellulosilyticus]|uniref:Chromate transporter n=1 Tax=Deinococcus cellulosilyticus (strain DSM 18568 / NBRC 106333 / KACC 11606 / 5516J-15) TaxID=1223518 RepID=A0A511MWV2_DEIC1|nr:chromate efflux transporter [Deinococcus cellulosilyticus]GEM45054.1 chromate transporter [Deinococcus cellulosilyticus NBRC 106333 = KACC 11606]